MLYKNLPLPFYLLLLTFVPTAGVATARRGGGVTTVAVFGTSLLFSCGIYRVWSIVGVKCGLTWYV